MTRSKIPLRNVTFSITAYQDEILRLVTTIRAFKTSDSSSDGASKSRTLRALLDAAMPALEAEVLAAGKSLPVRD